MKTSALAIVLCALLESASSVAQAQSTLPVLANASFEAPTVGSCPSFLAAPSGGSWTFTNAGITTAGCGQSYNAPPLPTGGGTQAAFLQAGVIPGGNAPGSVIGSITQTVSGFIAGHSYTISFYAAGRPQGAGCNDGCSSLAFSVLAGNTDILDVENPPTTSFQKYTTSSFSAVGNLAVEFIGTSPTGTDRTSFIDLVTIQDVTGLPLSANPTALSIPGTGQNVANGRDQAFLIVSDNTGEFSVPGPAFVVTKFGDNWVNPGPHSTWIGPASDQSSATRGFCCGGSTTYRTTFSLAGFDLSTVRLTLEMAVDDTASISLNGKSVSVSATYNGITSLDLTSNFIAGMNTLDFVVSNSGGGPTGLDVAITGAGVASPPAIDTNQGIVNGASFQEGIASATWVTIRGTNLSSTTRIWQNSDFIGNLLPTILDGVQVKINGKFAYVYYISQTQINVLAPDDATIGPISVQVITPNGTSPSVSVTKSAVAPALFSYSQLSGHYAIAQDASTYSLLGPNGLLGSGVTTTPAFPGETIVLYATGLGPTSPSYPTSQIIPSPASLVNPIQVFIGGVKAATSFTGIVGSGLYQINAIVPTLPSGDASVILQSGAVQSPGSLFISILSNAPGATGSYTISTLAGTGATTVNSGDGGQAMNAAIVGPNGVSLAGGNVYVSTSVSIRKIASNGIITTVAGSDTQGYSGDGGPAIGAKFNLATALAADSLGNLYVADPNNNAVRKVALDGTISTYAGNGTIGFGGDGGPANKGQIANPSYLAFDTTNDLYIACLTSIRAVSPGGTLSKIDTGTNLVFTVATDNKGNLYYVANGYLIRRSPSGSLTTLAGTGNTLGFSGDGGPASAAAIEGDGGLAVDDQGNIFIADFLKHRIRKIDVNGIITTIAGTGVLGHSGDGGPASLASIAYPSGLAIDRDGKIYFAESSRGYVRVLTPVP